MNELDKQAMGRRIRQIRLGAELRQWELAKLLGTTQSAIHKYEHGVVPESRRLVEVARIGETSLEWVLTGRHWENGSEQQQRVSSDLLDTAALLREVNANGGSHVAEALRILRDAVRALEPSETDELPGPEPLAGRLAEHAAETLRLLQSAFRIQNAVLHRVAAEATRRLEAEAQKSD